MFIERIEIPKPPEDRSTRRKIKVICRFRCDTCGKEYEKGPSRSKTSTSGLTFCSNPCKFASHRDGGLKEHALATCKECYGDERPMRTDDVKRRQKQTLLANHRVEHTMHDPMLKEKRRQTHLERYGVAETFQSPELRRKREATWSKRHGVPYVPFPENALELSRAAMERMFRYRAATTFLPRTCLHLRHHLDPPSILSRSWSLHSPRHTQAAPAMRSRNSSRHLSRRLARALKLDSRGT